MQIWSKNCNAAKTRQEKKMPSNPIEVVEEFAHDVPVDLEGMAKQLGLVIKYDPALPNNISGKIFRDRKAKSGFSVSVNANDAPRRQRFTLAHEIAHYVLHRDLISSVIDDEVYRSDLSNGYERQANRYAAKILLPAEAVRREFQRSPYAFILANRFDVSERAMEIRLKELSLA